jgi:lysophospholipase L1-like esterase
VRHLSCITLFVFVCAAAPCAADERAAGFPLQEGDVWVMAGDSITAQHLHSNYFEAFCYARYPKIQFAFRNSGVGGHTIPSTLARFNYDIAAWKPTVVSVELGMNDQGGTPTEKFVANMGTMVERIRSIKARPVIFSASPINNGDTQTKLGGNRRLNEYATALQKFSAQEKVPYADQFHALLDVWGKNKPRENLAKSIGAIKAIAADDSVAGVEHLRAFLAAQEKNKIKAVSMQGDAVHPGPPGQLMMAAALLKALGADGFVSSATLDASGTVTEAKGCKVEAVTAKEGTLAFDRLDECLPFPIPTDARDVLSLDPTILTLSQYNLKVTGLKDGDYLLKINGVPAGRLNARALASGVNLTPFAHGEPLKTADPIAAQAQAILSAVSAKEGLVSAWRGLSQKAHAANADPKLQEQLDALGGKVREADARIRAAAKAKKWHCELTPASAS